MRGLRALLVGALGVAVAACTAVWGFQQIDPGPADTEGRDASSPPPVEASVPGDVSAPRDAPPSDAGVDVLEADCVHARWPPPPDASDDDGSVGDIILAFKTFDLSAKDGAGLDLDDECTCPFPQSCVIPKAFLPNAACDESNGRDLVSSDLLGVVGVALGVDVTGAYQDAISNGYSNWLLRIRGYNGKPDDPNVVVALFVSRGTLKPDGGILQPPVFDGTDVWRIDGSLVTTLTADAGTKDYQATTVDLAAYVAGGTLVARPGKSDGPLVVTPIFGNALSSVMVGNGNPLEFWLSDLILVGNLVQGDGGTYSLVDGRAGGRLPSQGQYGALAALGSVCLGSLTPEAVAVLCESLDLTTRAADDGTGMSCDAVSFGAAFEATPANLGPLVFRPPPVACDASVGQCSQ